jgi:hypothetical protein
VEHALTPKKWRGKDYNEYEFQLHIVNVESFNVESFRLSGPTNITITQDGSNQRITLEFWSSCIGTCSAKSITITNIKAYHNDGAV